MSCSTDRPSVLALLSLCRLPLPHHQRTAAPLAWRPAAPGCSTDDFNAAQLKAVCVEAGMLALRRDGLEVNHEDFVEGITQVQAKKKANLYYYA
jgi:SpoVK/Ycf46/Vps4 family AAA+-type ATPase